MSRRYSPPRPPRPRRRPAWDRQRRKPTPGKFWIQGYPAGDGDNLYPVRRMLTWQGGALSGDAAMIAAAHERARALEGHSVGPYGGPYTVRDHLADPLSALFLLLDLFLPYGREAGGDVPVRAELPKGAIGQATP